MRAPAEQPHLRTTVLAALCLVVLALPAPGCAADAPQRAAQAPPGAPPAPPAEPLLQDRAWGVLRSHELGVKLALPEARSWFPLPTREPTASWELWHEPTSSSLSVRRWRASRLPRLEACELELRQRVPDVPSLDETQLVAARQVRSPAGFVTRVSLHALPGKASRLRGQALAIGAGVGECLAVIASTDCSSEAELAERLRLLDASLGHLRLIRVEDRVPAPAPPQ